jgi:hypothetical protein
MIVFIVLLAIALASESNHHNAPRVIVNHHFEVFRLLLFAGTELRLVMKAVRAIEHCVEYLEGVNSRGNALTFAFACCNCSIGV